MARGRTKLPLHQPPETALGMTHEEKRKARALIDARVFTTTAVAAGTGLDRSTIRSVRTKDHFLRDSTMEKIVKWMRDLKQQLP